MSHQGGRAIAVLAAGLERRSQRRRRPARRSSGRERKAARAGAGGRQAWSVPGRNGPGTVAAHCLESPVVPPWRNMRVCAARPARVRLTTTTRRP